MFSNVGEVEEQKNNFNNNIKVQNNLISPFKEQYNYFLHNNPSFTKYNNNFNQVFEFQELNPLIHFRLNLLNANKNCTHEITDFSYYCFTCKQSLCFKCGAYDHKEHVLVQRKKCLEYDKTFFNEIISTLDSNLMLENKKNNVKNVISSGINMLKNTLDKLRNNAFSIIDKIFEKYKNNLLDIKNNLIKAKNEIEKYYESNKNFFNLDFEQINFFNKSNNGEQFNQNIQDSDIIKNKDIENSLFILNFDLMNICDNKNLQVMNYINDINNSINSFIELVNNKCFKVQSYLLSYLDFSFNLENLEDIYEEINLRVEKYSEHINKFKETIYEILTKTSNYEKVKELTNIIETKIKKGKNAIFEQNFFNNQIFQKSNSHIKNKIQKNMILKRGKSGDSKYLKPNIRNNRVKLDIDNNSYLYLKTNLIKQDNSKINKTSISPFKTNGNQNVNKQNYQRTNIKINKSNSFLKGKNKYKNLTLLKFM